MNHDSVLLSNDPKTPVFDQTAFLARCLGNALLARKVLASFLANFSQDLVALQAEIATGGLDLVRKRAHKMRGASGNVAAARVQASCAGLERASADGDVANVTLHAEELTRAWDEFRVAVSGTDAPEE